MGCPVNLIPHVWELVLSQVPIEWRVINMNVHGPYLFLVTPCTSLSTIVKHSGITGCSVEWLDGAWAWDPEMFLQTVPKGSTWFSYVFLSTVDEWAFKPAYDPTFLKFVIPVFGGHEKDFNNVTSFEMYLDPQVDACSFEPFPNTKDEWHHYGDAFAVWSIVVVELVVSGCLSIVDVVFMVDFFYRALRAHSGKLQACSAFLMFSNSLCSACWQVQTTLALNVKELKTLFFAEMKWWLPQCRHWSVCVSFL